MRLLEIFGTEDTEKGGAITLCFLCALCENLCALCVKLFMLP